MTSKTTCLNGELFVGDLVLSTADDVYPCLIGVVTEIIPLGSPDHETENETDDVYVNFEDDFCERRTREIEDIFSGLYGEKKLIGDISLDVVIMDPDCLIKLVDVPDSILGWIKESEANAVTYGYKILRGLYDKLKTAHEGQSE